MNLNFINCLPDFCDWLIFMLSVLVTFGWALYIYSLRPKLDIGLPKRSEVDGKSILIALTNKKKFRKATRIKLEVAIIDANNDTYHLSVIEDDFAFLAELECRNFKAFKINEYLSSHLGMSFDKVIALLNEPNNLLRIRVHAADSFSGLGKCFEASFDYDKNNNLFKKTQ
jgi:hypothetical protein